ncbi:23S rRNA (pseudouridine(1915)-N(3))-methyltransferase RlmH [Sandarakinorhabdus oryzae]|uniref:23S rRNA (pseudouridine(1915)-N(3))-methyltransferase RlmH n=1 Tax=Sandarakinorhabdus oryzae TaxID=2675220 RepID=UPI0012E2E401|nr:23S rRNA (pseudouridine(1915)-N(3))-methyltransferase RlmH [Sandarakinorhabdus oryzae]
MKLHIVARGRIGQSPEAELVERYALRLRGRLVISEIGDTARWPAFSQQQGPNRTVVLDERGRDLPSTDLATLLGRWRDDGAREVRFLIGAADGHDEATRKGADLLLGFGKATWPHMLVRAMLAEQLYRALSILEGHPYHRE